MNADFLSHAEAQDLFPAYIANELDAERRNALNIHLDRCVACRAELIETQRLLGAFAQLQSQTHQEPSIVEAVMVQVREYAPYNEEQMRHDDSPRFAPFVDDENDRMNRASLNGSGSTGARSRSALSPARGGAKSLVAALSLLGVVALLAALLLSRLPGALGGQSKSSLAPTQASAGQGWRAFYIASNGLVHVVSDSGDHATNLSLPTNNFQMVPQSPRVGVSSDGRYLAYIQGINTGPVTVIDLKTNKTVLEGPEATELHWAPNSPRLAVDLFSADTPPVSIVDMTTLQVTPITAPAAQAIVRIVGWIDATHLVVVTAIGKIALNLETLDLTSEKLTLLTEVSEPPDLFLSPDGQRVFIAPTYWDHTAHVVDLSTNKVRQLPQIQATFASSLKHMDNWNQAYGGNWAYQWAWKPGTHTLALSLGSYGAPNEGETKPVTQDAGVWLVDVDGDQATRINQYRYPLAWLPDGKTLLMSSIADNALLNSGFVVGPTFYALTPVSPTGKTRVLVRNMLAFFGLVDGA